MRGCTHIHPPACPLSLFSTPPELLDYTANQMLKLVLILLGRQIAVCGALRGAGFSLYENDGVLQQLPRQPGRPLCYCKQPES